MAAVVGHLLDVGRHQACMKLWTPLVALVVAPNWAGGGGVACGPGVRIFGGMGMTCIGPLPWPVPP